MTSRADLFEQNFGIKYADYITRQSESRNFILDQAVLFIEGKPLTYAGGAYIFCHKEHTAGCNWCTFFAFQDAVNKAAADSPKVN